MSFYMEMATEEERRYYNQMLKMAGSLSNLFSTNSEPYLDYRVTENLFCRCLGAENLARGNLTADAKKGDIGVGIKTWAGSSLQKIAEFDKLKSEYEHDSDEEIIRKIAEYRNSRISFTLRTHALTKMVYHCIVRKRGCIDICECPLIPINVDNIEHIKRKKNSITFNDDMNEYSFNISKSTLYKRFCMASSSAPILSRENDLILLKTIPVDIIEDPYGLLAQKLGYIADTVSKDIPPVLPHANQLGCAILPLYSKNNERGKWVSKNNLNLRFAAGRRRDEYEVAIPIPIAFRRANPDFFPGRDISFSLHLPNGKVLSAKQCQDGGKALMSNPNNALGHWLIDEVLKISPDDPISYEMLARYGVDSVELKKLKDAETGEVFYTIDFAPIGSYEKYMDSLQGV